MERWRTARNVAIVRRDRRRRVLPPRRRAGSQRHRSRSCGWSSASASATSGLRQYRENRFRLTASATVTAGCSTAPRRWPCSVTWRDAGCGKRASASSSGSLLVALVVWALLEVYRHARSYCAARGLSSERWPRRRPSERAAGASGGMTLAEQRRALPDQPGVYLFRDGAGRVIYVGKAKSVRKRVASHFSKAQVPSSPGHAEMVATVEHVECVVVATEAEALLAEQSFIKQYRPRFNIRLRDDKSYPFIAISLDEDVPARLLHARAPPLEPRLLRPLLQRQAGARDARGAGEGVHVPLLHRSRAGAAQRQPLPGLLHQALRGAVRRLRHHARSTASIDGVIDFLSGPLLGDRARPRRAHARGGRGRGVRAGDDRAQPPAGRALAARAPARRRRLDGHLRRRGRRARRARGQRPGLPGARRRALRPPVLLPGQRDRARPGRGGRGVHAPVLRRRHVDPGAARRAARAGRASGARRRAREPARRPRRAARRRARREAAHPRARRAQRRAWRSTRSGCAPSAAARGASRRSRGCRRRSVSTLPPIRIECFDISNLGGTHTVASMVVFEGGAPKKSDYRRFKIRTTEGAPDDFASMAEVLERRFAQWERQTDISPHDPELRPELRVAAEPRRDRRRQGPARGRASGRCRASASAASP